MANVRIKDLTTTAATTASDDFFGVDGATNGTRKLNAFSPTFGGNLTVSGDVLLPTNSAYRLNGKIALLYNGSNFYIEPNNDLGNIIIGASAQTTYGFTVGGNLTVSGTGASSVAGNLLIGTTTDYGHKLQVNGGAVSLAGAKAVNGGVYMGLISTDASALSGGLTLFTNATGSSRYLKLEAFEQGFGGRSLVLQENGGSVLIATNVDSGNGKLQLATHTTSAGGIGFGTDAALYRQQPSQLALDCTGGLSMVQFRTSGTYNGRVGYDGSNVELRSVSGSVVLISNNTTALTLDTSQNATFAGTGQQSFNGIIQVAKTAAGANSNLLDLYNKGTTNNTSSGIAFSANNASSAQRTSAEIRGIMTVTTAGSEESELWFSTRGAGVASGTAALKIANSGNATFAGAIAIGNTVAAAAGVASTHKVTISIGGSTYYLLATNV